ncbi:MAG: hypothetical protein LQ338_007685, partial [Usnochroma carphineum]
MPAKRGRRPIRAADPDLDPSPPTLSPPPTMTLDEQTDTIPTLPHRSSSILSRNKYLFFTILFIATLTFAYIRSSNAA